MLDPNYNKPKPPSGPKTPNQSGVPSAPARGNYLTYNVLKYCAAHFQFFSLLIEHLKCIGHCSLLFLCFNVRTLYKRNLFGTLTR